jgi:hypothetical protein
MSLHAHLVQLEKRHRAIELKLESALAHPSSDDKELAELKRRKLLLKDEITRLKHRAPMQAMH